jgi:ABC-type uncharacterized transport system fused permease/ATPase subunit
MKERVFKNLVLSIISFVGILLMISGQFLFDSNLVMLGIVSIGIGLILFMGSGSLLSERISSWFRKDDDD